MVKDKERKLAEHYYVEKLKSAKEIAVILGVTEATISKWVNKGGWKIRRDSRALSPSSRAENIKELISQIADERLQLSRALEAAISNGKAKEASEIRISMAAIDNGAGMWNKALATTLGETKVSIATYLDVMEQIFNALRDFDEKVYLQTIDFQDNHINKISCQ